MLVAFSPTRTSTNRAQAAAPPAGKAWEGENWRDLGFDIYSYFPTFPANFPYLDQWLSTCLNLPHVPNPATWWGRGMGDFQINYARATADFWKYTALHNPLAVFTFSQTPKMLHLPNAPLWTDWKKSYQWEIEQQEPNRHLNQWTTTPLAGLSPLSGCNNGTAVLNPVHENWINNGPGRWEDLPNSPFAGEVRPPGFNGPDPTRPTGFSVLSGIPAGLRAEHLRQRLAAKHYNTTFTCFAERNPKARWYNLRPTWIKGHTVVDVHWPDGTTTWIEAQFPNGSGIGAPHGDLDGDGDGRVTAWVGKHKRKASDGNVRIEVYGSRQEAEAAGSDVPGV